MTKYLKVVKDKAFMSPVRDDWKRPLRRVNPRAAEELKSKIHDTELKPYADSRAYTTASLSRPSPSRWYFGHCQNAFHEEDTRQYRIPLFEEVARMFSDFPQEARMFLFVPVISFETIIRHEKGRNGTVKAHLIPKLQSPDFRRGDIGEIVQWFHQQSIASFGTTHPMVLVVDRGAPHYGKGFLQDTYGSVTELRKPVYF